MKHFLLLFMLSSAALPIFGSPVYLASSALNTILDARREYGEHLAREKRRDKRDERAQERRECERQRDRERYRDRERRENHRRPHRR